MRNYCSLADSKYLPQLLALYESLKKHSSEQFRLTVLAMDDECGDILRSLSLEGMTVCLVSDAEMAEPLYAELRRTRTFQEYCWTWASQLVECCMEEGDEEILYVDADVFFVSDPKAIFTEIGERSIGIVPHRFNERDRVRLERNGKFNVGVVFFRRSAAGIRCSAQWAEKCRFWCFNRHDKGRFADQAYLDWWENDFGDEVCVIQNLGVNLGPWSIGNYSITKRGENVFVNDDKLVCYHFHEYKNEKQLTNWKLRPEDIELIYQPYISACREAKDKIASVHISA